MATSKDLLGETGGLLIDFKNAGWSSTRSTPESLVRSQQDSWERNPYSPHPSNWVLSLENMFVEEGGGGEYLNHFCK